MSYYRNIYLKSPEWKSLRLQALLKYNFTCQICGIRKMTRDVHHLKYKRLFNVTKNDLKVLCRACHNKTHELLDKYPKLKKLGHKQQWKIVMQHLAPKTGRSDSAIKQSKCLLFGRLRTTLVKMGIVKRKSMRCHPSILEPNFIPIRKHPIIYLTQYIAVTGIDPRRTAFKAMHLDVERFK